MSDLARTLQELSNSPDFINLRTLAGVRVDLRYASADNFMGRDVYGALTEAFLHRLAAAKLARASELLRSKRADHELVVFDALRPRSVQRVLWAHVVGTPEEDYVAEPDRGSIHNFGCAIDLGVLDGRGHELDMGTGFDAFVPLSEPRLEAHYLQTGQLTALQIDNRLLLRDAMTGAGFIGLTNEWWHFDAFPSAEVRAGFRLIE